MKRNIRSVVGLSLIAIVALFASFALAADSAEKKGWGINDPYNKLYNPKELEKLKDGRIMRLPAPSGKTTWEPLKWSE